MGLVARLGKIRNSHHILIEKSEGKRPLGRPRHRREDNIKAEFTYIESGSV
jgi:hypothetical protein